MDFIFREPVTFANGETISIQASRAHYCTPRNNEGPYTTVEVGNTRHIELPSRWNVYAEPYDGTGFTVYNWVPAVLVHELIRSKGGIVSGEIPPLALDTYNNAPVESK